MMPVSNISVSARASHRAQEPALRVRGQKHPAGLIVLASALLLSVTNFVWLAGNDREWAQAEARENTFFHLLGGGWSETPTSVTNPKRSIIKANEIENDPNNGKLYARYTDTNPPFWISLYDEYFDKLRWTTVMMEGHYYETIMTSLFVEILNDTKHNPGLVLDVGGNVGWFTMLGRAMNRTVHVFEPNPNNVQRMKESLHLNQWEYRYHDGSLLNRSNSDDRHQLLVHVNSMGISNHTGSLVLTHDGANPGSAYVQKRLERSRLRRNREWVVSVLSVDEYAQRLGWLGAVNEKAKPPQIAILKIDIEGHEPEVVMGCRRLLKQGSIKHVLLELGAHRKTDGNATQKMIQTIDWMIEDNYRLHKWGKSPGPHLDPKPEWKGEKLGHQLTTFAASLRGGAHLNLWWIRNEQ